MITFCLSLAVPLNPVKTSARNYNASLKLKKRLKLSIDFSGCFKKRQTDQNQNSFISSVDHNAFLTTSLIEFSLSVKAATLILISGRGSAISSAKQGKSGSIK